MGAPRLRRRRRGNAMAEPPASLAHGWNAKGAKVIGGFPSSDRLAYFSAGEPEWRSARVAPRSPLLCLRRRKPSSDLPAAKRYCAEEWDAGPMRAPYQSAADNSGAGRGPLQDNFLGHKRRRSCTDTITGALPSNPTPEI